MRISKFQLAALLIIGVPLSLWLLFNKILYPAIIPVSLLQMYMFFIVIGILMYVTSNSKYTAELFRPIKDFITNPEEKRWIGISQKVLMVVIPIGFSSISYSYFTPKFSEPMALRAIHPAPPSTINVFNRQYNLLTLQNPYRRLEKEDPEEYKILIEEGGEIFFKNCFVCHGDVLDGRGFFAPGFNPIPANFQDVGTIAQLQESFLFWRISTGGPGLPEESWPWQSAMPIWQHFLSEKDIWKAILFLYDYTGRFPRTFD
jgi:hypothetical protein